MKTLSRLLGCVLIFLSSYPTPARSQVLNRPDFFRRGYDQMQDLLDQLQQTPTSPAPSNLLTIDGKTFQWQQLVVQTAGFSIWIPQGPQSQENVILDTSSGKISFDVLATHPQTWRFVTAYSAPLAPQIVQNPESLFLAIQQEVIEKTQFQLTEDLPANFQSYSGRKWTMENSQEIIYYRLYLIQQRLYLLAVRQPKSKVNNNSIILESFFGSFSLLK